MADEQRIIAVLGIGATKFRVMIAQAFEDDAVYCLGYAETPAEGIKRGVIVNMDKVTRVITRVVEEAESQANLRVDSLLVGISGDHIRSINSHGVINVSRSDNEILGSDISNVIATARDVAIPSDREIIHVLPQEYTVDGQGGIRNPIGMTGSRLEVESHIVTCSAASAKNIFRALERCELALGGFALESYAASYAGLTEAEKELGVALVDIGGETTEVAVFKDGCIRHSGCVTLGGQNITNDIAIGLRIAVDEAERLKITYGSALASKVNVKDMMSVAASGGRPERSIGKTVLATIIEARAEEILTLVDRELRRVDLDDCLNAGVTLIGGGSLLPGLVDLAEQTLNLPVKVGTASGVENLPDGVSGPEYATVLGLILHANENEVEMHDSAGGMRGMMKKLENWITGRF